MYGKNKSLHFLAKILIKWYHSYMYYFRKHGINNVYVIPNSFRNL
jgi:hypothetical protein